MKRAPVREISNLLDALGDGTAVAAALNKLLPQDEKRVKRDAVYKWKEANRAPYRIRPYLARVAQDNGHVVPQELRAFLAEPSSNQRAS